MKNKLKVSTRTNNFYLKSKKLLAIMSSYPEGITPKKLSSLSGINVNTIKSILPKLSNVKKIMRGFYKVVETGDAPLSPTHSPLHSWNFHNCILSSVLKDFPARLIKSTISLKLVNLEFTISTKGKAVCRLASDFPLNVSSICLYAGYYRELVTKYSNTPPPLGSIKVQTIEFNRDYANLRLDGVNCITLDNLTAQFKAYQKKRGLRIEHKTKVNLNVENVVDMLSSSPSTLDLNVKLNRQKEQLDRLLTQTSNQTKLLFNVIDKVNNQIHNGA
jgi:hypothetical protein